MQQGPVIRIGLVAEIATYEVVIVGDIVTVSPRDEEHAGQIVTIQQVRNLWRFIRWSRNLRVALAQFPDFEVVYIIDLAQDGYGYAVNVQAQTFSEWGTVPLEIWQSARGR